MGTVISARYSDEDLKLKTDRAFLKGRKKNKMNEINLANSIDSIM